MTCLEIIKAHLKENGYDGLCSEQCGCSVKNLGPCGDNNLLECEPAYRVKCKQPCGSKYCLGDFDPKHCKKFLYKTTKDGA